MSPLFPDRPYKPLRYPGCIDYRDWADASDEQRRAWNCALDLLLSRPLAAARDASDTP